MPRKPLSPISLNVGSPLKSSGKTVCPSSSNTFSVLAENSKDFDKEALIERYRKPPFMVTEAQNAEVEAASKKNKPSTKGAGKKSKNT